MGRVRVIKTGPMATIQDFGRFGYRRYGIPRSGAMDRESMIAANKQVGNPEDYPVIEFALMGMELEALDETMISIAGAKITINGERKEAMQKISAGDKVTVSAPTWVYGYLAIGGKMDAKEDFDSFSTYERAGFGGLNGRGLKNGDVLKTKDGRFRKTEVGAISQMVQNRQSLSGRVVEIRMMKGPEWDLLKELPGLKTFQVDGSSDRMGIRFTGTKLACDYREIASSAVIPGIIQLPADGHPIVLMNDCQTTGGYPRIGKVVEEDLGKLAQVRPGEKVRLML